MIQVLEVHLFCPFIAKHIRRTKGLVDLAANTRSFRIYPSSFSRIDAVRRNNSSQINARIFCYSGNALLGRQAAAWIGNNSLLCQQQSRISVYDQVRLYATRISPRDNSKQKYRNRTTLNYVVALAVLVLGLSYAAVPMYRVFCQVTGMGGASNLAQHGDDEVEKLQKVTDRRLRILFTADTASHLQWHFKPVQKEVTVYPGETALAFYTAKNPTDRAIVGISTYTVLPYEAAKYLHKIQCFCFEEQRLNSHEQVDMPVFFYIDPEYVNDPWLQNSDTVTLSYTFFEAKEGMKLLPQGQPVPHLRTAPGTVVIPA